MSGGGSQVTAATPWGAAQPYLTDIMGKAQQLYGSLAPNYTNPNPNFTFGNTTGAVGNIINGTSPFGGMASGIAQPTTQAIQQQLTGQPDYTAVKQALDAANAQTWDSFNNQFVPQLNQRASFLGNPSGAIKDLNWATANIGKNMDLNAQQQYLGEYDQAKARQAAAAGLGANIAQGAGGQALQGASLFGSLSQLPQSNLADYANIISGTGGKFGTSTETNKAGAAGTAANIIGGLTAGTGLLNSIFGTGSNGASLAGKAGSVFGGGSAAALPSTAGAAADATGSIASGASTGMANTAADVAASNSAYLGGSGLGAGAAGGGASVLAGGAPALQTVGGLGDLAMTGEVADALGTGAAGAGGAGAAGSTGGALAGGGAGDAAGGATLGAGAGAASALAIAALPYILSQTVHEGLDASWWKRAEQGLAGGKPGPNATPQQTANYYNALTTVLGLTQDPKNGAQASQLLAKYGIDQSQLAPVTGMGAAVQRVGSRPTQRY